MPYTLYCRLCGTTFASKHRTAKFCSDACRKRQYREDNYKADDPGSGYIVDPIYDRTERKRAADASMKRIADIERKAREEGLSYGQFVARYGGK